MITLYLTASIIGALAYAAIAVARRRCWLDRHDWNVQRINLRKAFNLCHLHPMAGMYATCRKCGHIWDDLWSPFFAEDHVAEFASDLGAAPKKPKLPKAEVVK